MTERSQEQLPQCISPTSDHLLKVVDPGVHPVSKKSDGNTTFLRAARSGNLEKVLEFINANVDINTSNSNGLNALHLASKDGHKEVVAELLKRGANVDAATKKGNTALHIASLAGQEEVVKLLIENGASVNVQSQSGFTPLYMAAQENHERVVRYLLNNGANQTLATEDGFTPLAVAMQQGHEKVVTELLENDTRGKIRLPALHIAAKKDDCKAAALLLQSEHNNPDITSKSGFTPLHIASHYGNDAIASILLTKGADVNYAAKHNITPLHVAAKWGRNNMVLLLLDKGASIVAKTRDGLTPLHCAARSGHEEVVDTLLQRHAPITAKTKNGLAPLHMASQGDHVEAARVLLQHRAPVDDVTVDYLTALHVASHCGHVSVAKLLLDRKADPNARALNGFTPLHIACKKNRVKVVELLLKHGASIESTTESGLSPLHVASFMGCMNIVIYLLQCEANPDVSTIRGETPLHLAARANQTDIIRILLRNGAQVDAKAREQQTPLHIASRLGNQDIVMLLLQHGASVDSMTKDQYTPLHIAAKEDQEEVAQVLLDNNASMTATTKKGFTPLHLAAKYGRTKIATLLLQRGAPVDAQGKNGVTPLHVASHYDHQGIALLLLDKGASPHAIAKNGHTPLHIAAKKNQMDIAAMLLEYGASAEVESKAGFTPLHLSAQEGHADMTNLLLEHKSNVNHSSKNGLTPIHLCAQEDCVEVAKILVQNGADLNAVTKAGYTPLHIASHFGQLNMVRYLLSQKVKVDCTTSTGYTPLHQAAQQGNSAIVAVLLDNGASPDSKNNQGQTALCIAQKLGYISVVEVLKNVTEMSKGSTTAAGNEEKYKVVAPETMQENFMSDSEDEGGDDVVNEQSYRYLTIDEMKSLGDDSLPLDVTREDRYDTTAGIDESISPQHTYNHLNAAPPALDNIDVSRGPIVQSGFLVSFLVDAKGGAMRGCRHSGVRVIVPPQCVTMPTRVTCRYVRRDKPNHPPPPPLMEGEALASRILELGPVGVKFLGPVVIEVPNFAALRGNEREIVILRSDNGETWREHTVDSSNEAVQEILSRSFDKDGNQIQVDEPGRITSIVTNDFPHYFAVVSRIRQEVHAIGPEGGMVSSSVVPQVQAVFPPGALTKKIKVGLQAQPIPSDLTAAVLGNCVAVSPIVTIEPRRRKFHKPITLTLPVPQAANKGMINQYSGDAPTLRLLCSITGGTSRAQWEDVTGSTPLTFVKECVSFTTTVSARFWLMDVRDIAVATKKATELYREAIHIPFMAKFVVFAKRVDNDEARLRVFCMTDDKEDKTLECQEHFIEVAKSRDVEVLEGKQQLVELSGNLISVTKSGDQLKLGFHAFQENRLPFTVRLKDSHGDPVGRMLFFKEQKPVKMSTPHPPVCVLNIVLPDGIVPDHDLLDSPMRNYSYSNDVQGYHRSELRFSDISNLIDEDWLPLSEKLGISSAEAAVIRSEYPESVPKQALTMLRIWHQQAGNKASANILESALLSIGRDDIVQECILNTTDTSKKKLIENGLQASKSVMSEIIEDYQIGKHNISSTDDDEKKYTAEEKVVLDDEPKKSVSERKTEIEKRLQSDPTKRMSKDLHKDSIEKRHSVDTEPVIKRQPSQSKDFIKNSGIGGDLDEKETFEPTTLTFEQKRLSFERGLSFDKGVVPDSPKESSVNKFIQIEKSEPLHDIKNTVVEEENIKQIDKSELKTERPDQHSTETPKLHEPFEHFHIVKDTAKKNEAAFVEKERELSFVEKRLSFELGADTKVPEIVSKSTVKDKAESASNLAKSEVERRDSELFEGVSLGLGKLEAKSKVTEQNFLSPKFVKTPPPSPAEFRSDSLQKQDSEESNKSEKLTDKRTTDGTESSSKSSDLSSDDTVCVVKKRQCVLKDDDDLRRRPVLDDSLSVRRKRNALKAFCERFRNSRYPFEVDVDTSSSISSNPRSVYKSSSSSFGSYSHSINYAGDKLNMVSFKKQFAASCLPSSVWNRSLPNISFTMMSSSPTSLLLSPSSSSYHTNEFFIDEYSLPHCSSVEYFTPERNYTPKCGAYCTWLPSDDCLSEEITDPTIRFPPAYKVPENAVSKTLEADLDVLICPGKDNNLNSVRENNINLISNLNTAATLESLENEKCDSNSVPVFQSNIYSISDVKTTVDLTSTPGQKVESFSSNEMTDNTMDSINGAFHAASFTKDAPNLTPVTNISLQPTSIVVETGCTEPTCAAQRGIDLSLISDVGDKPDSTNETASLIKHSAVPISETTSVFKNGITSTPNFSSESTESIPVTEIEDGSGVHTKSIKTDSTTAIVENSANIITAAVIDHSNLDLPSRSISESTSKDTCQITSPVVASSQCEFIKSESICEIAYDDEQALYEEKDDICVPMEAVTIGYVGTEEATPIYSEDQDFVDDEARRNELIDLLIEKENAKLIASGVLGYDSEDSDEDESDENNVSAPPAHIRHQSTVYGAESNDDHLEMVNPASNDLNGCSSAHKSEPMPKQNTYDIIEEQCILRDSPRSYQKLGEANSPVSSRLEHYHIEFGEKSPQRKVAFRLNSADDDLVYPGQTDSEECNSSSENSEETSDSSVEERLENEESSLAPVVTCVESPLATSVVTITETTTITTNSPGDDGEIITTVVSTSSDFNPSSAVERKFERMASESLDECGPVAEGEFQKIVSQLSVEEVDDCLNEWNETQKGAVLHDKSSKLEGNKRQYSCAEKETPPVSPRDGVPKGDTDKHEYTDYISKKKFWQSFESSTTTSIIGAESKLTTPVPKPRASICTTGLTDMPDTTPTPSAASRHTFESTSRASMPSTRKDRVVNKSESEDNVLFTSAVETAAARVKPSMRQMHSLTICSTDSEAEYVASCGVEKLAYENMAFSEEDENRVITGAPVPDSGNVKSKKMFFEQQMHSSLEDNTVHSSKDTAIIDVHIEKLSPVSQQYEDHLDKSEVENSEKKKHSLIEDIEDPSTATPIDILLTNGCSVEGSADSTRSESDYTPEELRSVSDLSVEAVSETADLMKSLPKSDLNHSVTVESNIRSSFTISCQEPNISKESEKFVTVYNVDDGALNSTNEEASVDSIYKETNKEPQTSIDKEIEKGTPACVEISSVNLVEGNTRNQIETIILSQNIKEVESVQQIRKELNSFNILQNEETVIPDKSISTSVMKKSVRLEEPQIVLEKVITSDIPVNSVITTKRITTTDQIEKETLIESPKTDIITQVPGKVDDENINIEEIQAVDSKISQLLPAETTRTTIITSEKSGGFIQTQTVEEKVILDPHSLINTPVSSIITTKHSFIEESPVEELKKATIITSHINEAAEELFLIKEESTCSTLINSVTDNESRIDLEIEASDKEKSIEEIILSSKKFVDTVDITEQMVETKVNSSITESKIPLKDVKTSSFKESRIPIRKTVSREKNDENVICSRASLPTTVSNIQLESGTAVSKSYNQLESEMSEKVDGSSIEKVIDSPVIQAECSSNVNVEHEDDKFSASPIATESVEFNVCNKHNSKVHFSLNDDAIVESVTQQLSKSVVDAEHCDIFTDTKVCDNQLLLVSSIYGVEDDLANKENAISGEQIGSYNYNDEHNSLSEDEAKVVAENLIDEIETELNQRPDLVENFLLSQMGLLCQDTNDLIADDSNDITDEELRSTGTETDMIMPESSDFTKKADNAYGDLTRQAEIKISEASPTEYEINYEQVEEFSIVESADFEERVIPEESDLDKDDIKDSSFGLENRLEHTAAKPPIPENIKKSSTSSPAPEIYRKSSGESTPRTDILSPESGSSDTTSRRFEDATSSPSLAVVTRTKKHHDIDPCSSSSESHYHSITSRPCSSDIEGLLSLSAVQGSSEYETAASRNTSSYSHEFHTAISSASIHESLKSIDSESSGHLGSAEVSSEISETLVPSSAELEHEIDFPGGGNAIFEDTPRNIYSKTFVEPYDQDIPINIIKGTSHMENLKLEQPSYKLDTTYNPLQDEHLQSSCEDMSSLSTTDGGTNVQTVVEVVSTESDKMDISLFSEQNSLTISGISNQLSTSSSDFKDEIENDRKTADTNTINILSTSHPDPVTPSGITSVTLLTSMSEDQGRHNVNTQVTSNIAPSTGNNIKSPDISPDGESFELIEKPDLLDDFVVIEEVAKEAFEHDTEGRSICIIEKRKSGNFDDDILIPPPQTVSTLTHVEYYEPSGGTSDNACSFEQVTFEEKRRADQLYEGSPPDDDEYARDVEEGKKWIEMQFQTDSEATAYEYNYDRAPLEDIKEEDTDEMQSSKVGSVSSQISQSIGSLGSMKQSLSSTPDYDILAGKRYFCKSAEPDTVSQASLQEFERLEQLMALESMKGKLSASQDSISSGSNEKKCSIAGDDISVSSLKEFEGLELACGEVEKIEERAKAEERCLSQIEEGHESQASESESCETLEKSCYESDIDEDDYDKKMFEIDEIIRQAQSNVEKFADRLEKTESLGRGDSFEETALIPELEFDLPLSDAAATNHLSSKLYSGKKYIENLDLSHSLTESTDSLELKQCSITGKYLDDPVTSTDSLEGGGSSEAKSKLEIASDSLDNRAESPRSEPAELLVHDEYDSSSVCRLSPNQISSPDSADATSSAATHATYQNEMDSIMSSSFTSVESNTMVSSTENIEQVVSSYSSWLEGSQQTSSITTTKLLDCSSGGDGIGTQLSTTCRTIEMPVEVEGVKVVYKGPQAKRLLEQEIASFKPGEYVTETREVGADGRVRVKRVIETRTVLSSEQTESCHTTLKVGTSNNDANTDDASGGSESCSKVTTIHSNFTLAGPVSESNNEQEKKKDVTEDTVKDVEKNKTK